MYGILLSHTADSAITVVGCWPHAGQGDIVTDACCDNLCHVCCSYVILLSHTADSAITVGPAGQRRIETDACSDFH